MPLTRKALLTGSNAFGVGVQFHQLRVGQVERLARAAEWLVFAYALSR
jgi:hypothetical protein